LHVRLGLLSTPPHGDAVTFDYRERTSPERGLAPLRSRLLPGARIPAFAGMTILFFVVPHPYLRAYGVHPRPIFNSV
ncbi:MAG TPA: hypothetical protein VEF34_03725, partial [Syntrophobacteraceae bacterium]|nr:hypothetical protein [Syntrophobacteraceae bacterium]